MLGGAGGRGVPYKIHRPSSAASLQGVPKRTQNLLKLSISKALVYVSFVHLYDGVGKIFLHNCATFQAKYSSGH